MCGRARSNIGQVNIGQIIINAMANVRVNRLNEVNNGGAVNNADNVSPGMMMYVAHMNESNTVNIEPMLWGITMKDMTLFNTQVESLDTKPMYWKMADKNRGVVFVDGYYEWKGSGKSKTKYLIKPDDGKYFMLPVLFNGKNKFTILTQDPISEEIKSVHHRQPVILSDEQMQMWLSKCYSKDDAWNNINVKKMYDVNMNVCIMS